MFTIAGILQLLAFLYIFLGIGILINQKMYKETFSIMTNNIGVLALWGGAISFAIGYVIIAHTGLSPVGVPEWALFILGVAALIKGVMYLVLPNVMKSINKTLVNYMCHMGVGVILVGIAFYIASIQ